MPQLVVTIGDPTGIGPEVLAKALAGSMPPGEILVIGDAAVWAEAQRLSGAQLPPIAADRPGPPTRGGIPFLDVPPADRSWTVGRMSAAAGRAAAEWLEHAVRLAIQGAADAVVFAPLNKQAIIRAGFRVSDEYEFVASLAGVGAHDEVNVIPHPAGPAGGSDLLWVARVTSHLPLSGVAASLTIEQVQRAIRLAHRTTAAAGAASPRIGVAAFNPHAGEGGLLGDEETRVIGPAIQAALHEGINASGPHPADHIFRLARAGHFDAIVAMYHDQAQIATKLLGFDRGVSVGVGYSFVLATPSHGTAFDIAGRGIADPGPMQQALALAARLARR